MMKSPSVSQYFSPNEEDKKNDVIETRPILHVQHRSECRGELSLNWRDGAGFAEAVQ